MYLISLRITTDSNSTTFDYEIVFDAPGIYFHRMGTCSIFASKILTQVKIK